MTLFFDFFWDPPKNFFRPPKKGVFFGVSDPKFRFFLGPPFLGVQFLQKKFPFFKVISVPFRPEMSPLGGGAETGGGPKSAKKRDFREKSVILNGGFLVKRPKYDPFSQ